MIQLKLLKIDNVESIGVDNLEKFIEGLNNILEKPIEIVNKIDIDFDGYYLLPMGFTLPEDANGLVKENINEKVFLLSVINSSIPRILQECKPAGLTNWVLFKEASTAIIGNEKSLRKARYSDNDFGFTYPNYRSFVPVEADDTYETVAKSILKYLELYDNYLKNK